MLIAFSVIRKRREGDAALGVDVVCKQVTCFGHVSGTRNIINACRSIMTARISDDCKSRGLVIMIWDGMGFDQLSRSATRQLIRKLTQEQGINSIIPEAVIPEISSVPKKNASPLTVSAYTTESNLQSVI